MKKPLLVLSAVWMLAGCSDDTNSNPAPVTKVTEVSNADISAFRADIGHAMSTMDDGTSVFAGLVRYVDADPSLRYDDTWLDAMVSALQTMENGAELVHEASPPPIPELREAQDIAIAIAKETQFVVDEFPRAFDNQDMATIRDCSDAMGRASKLKKDYDRIMADYEESTWDEEGM